MNSALRRIARSILPHGLISSYQRRVHSALAQQHGLTIRWHDLVIDVARGTETIRLAARHRVYVSDIIGSFDYYFSAVRPVELGAMKLVDYSTPRIHEVVGFDDFPVLFPSFSEPLVTTEQYLEFAGLGPGMGVIDLGAYAGLTSILFARSVGPSGRVVAVDADETNFRCLLRNLARYETARGHRIDAVHGAVWNHSQGIEFSVEGNMGASAASVVGRSRGAIQRVPSFTLDELATTMKLQQVDFVKCDIEGAESVALLDERFFGRFRPRLIIETHFVDGEETTGQCIQILERFGYRCRRIPQHGVSLPLLECTPS